jgi:hypothetical protein
MHRFFYAYVFMYCEDVVISHKSPEEDETVL